MKSEMIIHEEGGANYEVVFSTTVHQVASMHGDNDIVPYIKRYIEKTYGADVPINYDAIDAFMGLIELRNGKGVYELRYNNLYTYVLMNGIVVPYCNWIYEDFYAGPRYDYRIDKSGKGTRIERATPELVAALKRAQLIVDSKRDPLYLDGYTTHYNRLTLHHTVLLGEKPSKR